MFVLPATNTPVLHRYYTMHKLYFPSRNGFQLRAVLGSNGIAVRVVHRPLRLQQVCAAIRAVTLKNYHSNRPPSYPFSSTFLLLEKIFSKVTCLWQIMNKSFHIPLKWVESFPSLVVHQSVIKALSYWWKCFATMWSALLWGCTNNKLKRVFQ